MKKLKSFTTSSILDYKYLCLQFILQYSTYLSENTTMYFLNLSSSEG